MGDLSNKHVLMILAIKGFRDEEFTVPFEYFKSLGAEVTVASTQLGVAIGSIEKKVEIDVSLNKVDYSKYDALMFVGGPGTPTVRESLEALDLAKKFANEKVLGAICWAPTILAKAGVLDGKKFTVWVGMDQEYEKSTDEMIKNFGGIFLSQDVVVDGNIVTGNGAHAAKEFAEKFAELLY